MKKTSLNDTEIIEINKRCYDTLGVDYTDGMADFEQIKENGIWQYFLDSLPEKGNKILNVGCGAGDASEWLDKHNFEVVSTDISPEMIRITTEKLPKARNIVLGATELEQLSNESFDGIIAIHVIQQLNENLTNQFFRQVYDLLNNDGKFLLVFTNNCFPKDGYQLEGSKEDVYIAWYKYNLENIVPLLNKARLQPIQFWKQKTLMNACGTACPFAFLCQKGLDN